MAIRPLNFGLQAMAKKSLNESQERIEADLKHVKEWLQKQPHLQAHKSDQWLIAFLRACKYSLENTKQKLDMYYTTKSMIPEFHQWQNPNDPTMNRMLKTGYFLPLPLASPDAPRILYVRPGVLDPKDSYSDAIMSLFSLFMKYLVMMDDNCVVPGIHCIVDMEGFKLSHIVRWYPGISKKAMVVIQDAFPSRPQSAHFIHLPPFFEPMFNLIRSFLSEKLNKRIQIHSYFSDIKKYFPAAILPKEIGGEGPSFEELSDEYMKKLTDFYSWYGDDTKYGCDEMKRPGKPKTCDDLFGLEGSFRPVNID